MVKGHHVLIALYKIQYTLIWILELRSEHAASNERLKYVKAPYIRGVSERCSKILLPYGIKLAHKSEQTLRSKLCKLKDPRPTLERTGCVYKIDCNDCSKKYIGETGKEITKRIAEHQRAVRRGDSNSNIFSHIFETKHNINWSNASILAQNDNNRSRKLLEAMHTQENSRYVLNRAMEIPATYLPVVSRFIKWSP